MSHTLIVADAVRTEAGRQGNAVLVEGTRIAAVGDASALASPGVATVQYSGATLVSGLVDAHLHPVGYAASLLRPILKGARDFRDLADIIGDAARTQPSGSAIVALRLDDESLSEGRLPDRTMLDSVAPDRPVLAIRYCGHVAVANTRALEMAGITPDTPDPRGGAFDRDPHGAPTGVLRETAVEPVATALGRIAPPVTPEHLVTASRALAAVGLTRIGAMVDLEEGCWAGTGSELDLILEAAPDLAIPMEIFVIAHDAPDLDRAAGRIGTHGGRLRFAGVKMFSDGSLGGHTAAMHHGFADDPTQLGTDRLDPTWARSLADHALTMGGRVAIHAIGDRANGNVLDLMEDLIGDGADPARLRIEHASVLTEDDISRCGRLGVTASVQPAFISSETEWLEKRLGRERLARTYAFRSLADAGAFLAGGSDSPVEPPHPLLGMAAARDRHGIVPEEGLDAGAAFAMFTTGAGSAVGQAAHLAPGALASFTVLTDDPIDASPDTLRQTGVVATWVEGEAVTIPADIVTWKG